MDEAVSDPMSVEQATILNERSRVVSLEAPHALTHRAEADESPTASLLEEALAATDPRREADSSRLADFLRERSPQAALAQWLRGRRLAQDDALKPAVARLLARDLAEIDDLINAQVNAIIHHPRFQQLEASWRGLRFLVQQAEPDEGVMIRVLNVTWSELARDAEQALEFDQSQLFRKIYSEEFGAPGGLPFGLLVGDYQIRHKPSAEHPIDDLSVLGSIAQVAAASFSPFVSAAHPSLFGLDDFAQLERPMSLPRIFEQLEYIKWNALRDSEDARFLGLALPRVLMRTPYVNSTARSDGFCFREEVEGPDCSGYLWGNAAYAFAAVAMRAFAASGWLADIRGVRRGEAAGGLVTGLPAHNFGVDAPGVSLKSSTDVVITEDLEKELSDLGFIPLCHCKDTEFCAFHANQSVQRPKKFDQLAATTNARMSSMLQYVLCASRVAHYLKVLARDKIGSFAEAHELQDFLTRWVTNYVSPDAEASEAVKARFPLREAQVRVRERPGRPGEYFCDMHLLPHYQLDALTASVKLRTEMAQGRAA